MSKPGIDERDLVRAALRAAKRRGMDPYNSAEAAGREWPAAFRPASLPR